MAGMAGIIREETTGKDLGEMLKKIRHRGNDDTLVRRSSLGAVGYIGNYSASQKSIGFSSGEWPLVLMDGFLVREDAEKHEVSDADYVKALYAQHGKDAFSLLRGSFSGAVVDDQECVIFRDHVGARPVVYHAEGDDLVFASEGKSLTRHAESVEELEPGCCYSTKDGRKSFPQAKEKNLPDCSSVEEAVKAVRDMVIEAVEQAIAHGDVQGVALSGGLDSSIILAVASQYDSSLKAFSTTVAEHPGEDLHYAKMMAERFGVEHHIYGITQKDIEQIIPSAVYHLESFDEDCISGYIANYYTSRLAAKHMNSVLVGEGADELFGGYFRELQDIDDPEEKERIGRRLLEVAYNTALRRLDRAWMANGVEYHAPFIDPGVAAAANAVPMELKVKEQNGRPIEKWILREAFRDMLPREIADRPKLRFARGVGVDSMMDQAVEKHVSQSDFDKNPVTRKGIKLNSPKELYYYQLFQERFPAGYEGLTGRWDPFK